MLDNCEHLLDAAAAAGRCGRYASARRCGSWRRAAKALAIAGERLWPLRSLPVPAERRASIRRRCASDAVRLFCERAPRARPGLRARRVERGRGRGDLSAPRRHPARDRARGGARGVDDARRDRRASRRTLPPAGRRSSQHGRAPPDPARDRRLVVFAARRDRAHGVRPTRCVLGQLRCRQPRVAVAAATASTRGTCVDALVGPGGQVDGGRSTRPRTTHPPTCCSKRCACTRSSG